MVKNFQWFSRLLWGTFALAWACLACSQGIDWQAELYNPQPLSDDVLLPMPCGGAMAFRWVQANGKVPNGVDERFARLYRQIGAFARFGSHTMLVGKYEVTEHQYQVIQAHRSGHSCPASTVAGRQVQGQVGWHDATRFATHWSRWLERNADRFAPCNTAAMPCLPKEHGRSAFVRLPTEAEWEYVARGGIAVRPAQFVAALFPMPEGLDRYVWYANNSDNRPKPIGFRLANPLGLHDLYGNVEEFMLEPYRSALFPGQAGAAMIRGGSIHSKRSALGATRRNEAPFYSKAGAMRASDNGFRLVATFAVMVSPSRAEREQIMPLPAPPQQPGALGHMQINVDVAADVIVDGTLVGRARVGEPVNVLGLKVGLHALEVTSDGYVSVKAQHRVHANRWTQVAVILPEVTLMWSWIIVGVILGLVGLIVVVWWLMRRRATRSTSFAKPAWATSAGTDEYGLYAQFEVNHVRQTMRWIEPGAFMMGSPANEKGRSSDECLHPVTLTQGFWLADTVCTQALWRTVMGNNPSHFVGDERPVENVSRHALALFIRLLNETTPGLALRLPSEAQWEYACRAGTHTAFAFGDDIDATQVNYASEGTVVVKSLPANPWGLYQMQGNVWEWCSDRYADYADKPQVDPHGTWYNALMADFRRIRRGLGRVGKQYVTRGGCWLLGAQHVRCAYRSAALPDQPYSIGLRFARGE